MKTKTQWLYTALMLGLAVNMAKADETGASPTINWVEPSFCMVAQSLNNLQKTVYLTQQMVENGAQELVVIAPDEQNRRVIKRITYQQNQVASCHYPAIAMARGGDWGWFLVWAEADKLYYTRMDAEALVFAPLKSLPIAQVTHIEFLPDVAQPTIRVQNQAGQAQMFNTDDEGRYWQVIN